ncbi:putative E3 ubiquitin-protein ligase [Trypanosoma cruzi]|uniref:RBR-type E3 ubiquitin transferase n=2 Tax=Trypanosoma cruzi TaxID=5693 RepID=Q4CVL5_TRYCC|nr:hypothetical protein, conserved [Trypanosoma cruzi]EAN84316.1 hypothetical protein, conserved [Trypanosoma cruzi]KAF5226573.1 hypothetical protein ECC02_000074 [Trypanosoma cruzi]PWV15650.1 putative E3 ubiquitin-protein ligase [Trypanosoma cruzi]RNC57157.1 RING finger protein [Trypanosoma cruzi]|eukprot:XP_806167.1 hypothetical protein [Trypanosoma cruzi strain CL Brener]
MSYVEEEYYDSEEYAVEYEGNGGEWALVSPAEVVWRPVGARAEEWLFTTLSISEVLGDLQRDVEKVNEILGLTPEAALLVLRHYGWKMNDATLEKYFNDMDKVNSELRITEAAFHGGGAGAELIRGEQPIECPICGDDVSAEESVALGNCRHFLCVNCLRTNLLCAVKHGHDLLDKRCPIRGCHSLVGLNLFKELLPARDYGQVQRRFLNDYFISNRHMCCCPNEATCEGVICVKAIRESGLEVQCHVCKLKFCFNCLRAPHAPATCDMMQRWERMLQENEPSLALIKEMTKGCPNCAVRVEKNMGCNHMTCVRCHHEYCWVCLGPWSEHNAGYYSCNKRSRSDKKVGKDLLLDCFERWDNHKRSIALEAKSLEECSKKLRKLTQHHMGTSTPDRTLSVLFNTQRVLHDCRVVLMNAYIALFFSEKTGTSLHYRIHQLELRTEETSRVIDVSPELIDTDEIECHSHQALHWCNVLRGDGFD